jgi:hypothetical protein
VRRTARFLLTPVQKHGNVFFNISLTAIGFLKHAADKYLSAQFRSDAKAAFDRLRGSAATR